MKSRCNMYKARKLKTKIFERTSNIMPRAILMYMALLMFGFISVRNVQAQDPHFTQFYANPLYLNPAFAGTTRCPRFVMNYRNQWPSLSGTFVTYSASYDLHVEPLQGGLGFRVLADRAGEGTLTTISGNVLYSYLLEVNRKTFIKGGFEVGYIQKMVDWNRLTFGDMIDPRYGFIYQTSETQVSDTRGNLDISTGLLMFSRQYAVGFSLHHLTQPKEGFVVQDQARLPLKITVHGGIVIPLDDRGDDFNISPSIMYQKQQDFHQINLGFYLRKGQLAGGLWYHHAELNSDALMVLLGVELDIFKIVYSYDLTLSRLSGISGGAHELSFRMQFNCRPKTKKWREEECPSFG